MPNNRNTEVNSLKGQSLIQITGAEEDEYDKPIVERSQEETTIINDSNLRQFDLKQVPKTNEEPLREKNSLFAHNVDPEYQIQDK